MGDPTTGSWLHANCNSDEPSQYTNPSPNDYKA